MRKITWTLMVGAAMTVTTTVVHADDLNPLRAEIDLTPLIAEIEALQNQVSQLEAQPAAAMPTGYDLLSIRDGQGTFEGVLPERNADKVREDSGFTLSVLPMADATPVAELSVSGEIRSAVVFTDRSSGTSSDDSVDMQMRGRLTVKGKVDTAVGEVGGYVSVQKDNAGNILD